MAESEPNQDAAQDVLWEVECARRTLLSHLGITPLVSRFDPIAAKPAQRLDMPTGSSDVIPANAPATAKGGEEMQAAQLREMLRDDADAGASAEQAGATSRAPAEETDEAAVDRNESPATAKTGVTSDTPFSLLLVTSGDVLWVEVLEDQLLRQEQLQLIAAMARSIRGASVRCAPPSQYHRVIFRETIPTRGPKSPFSFDTGRRAEDAAPCSFSERACQPGL